MPRVTVGKSEAAEAATREVEPLGALNREVVVEAAGHKFTLREPGIMDEVRILRLLGPEDSEIPKMLAIYTPLAYLTAIDGKAIPPSSSRLNLDGVLNRVGKAGMFAIIDGIGKHFAPASPEDERAEVKN